jgi:anti-sigma B factor antagonist
MRDELHITYRRNGAGEELVVTGELDGNGAGALEREIAGRVDGGGGQFRLDINGLAFADVSGGQALLHVHNAIEACGARVVFEHPTKEVLRVLRLLGLDQVLDIRP